MSLNLIKRVERIEKRLGIVDEPVDFDALEEKYGLGTPNFEAKVIREYQDKGFSVSVQKFVMGLPNTNIGYTIEGTKWVNITWEKLLALRFEVLGVSNDTK